MSTSLSQTNCSCLPNCEEASYLLKLKYPYYYFSNYQVDFQFSSDLFSLKYEEYCPISFDDESIILPASEIDIHGFIVDYIMNNPTNAIEWISQVNVQFVHI